MVQSAVVGFNVYHHLWSDPYFRRIINMLHYFFEELDEADGIEVDQLELAYEDILGEPLDFTAFGFLTVNRFLQTLSEDIIMEIREGIMWARSNIFSVNVFFTI